MKKKKLVGAVALAFVGLLFRLTMAPGVAAAEGDGGAATGYTYYLPVLFAPTRPVTRTVTIPIEYEDCLAVTSIFMDWDDVPESRGEHIFSAHNIEPSWMARQELWEGHPYYVISRGYVQVRLPEGQRILSAALEGTMGSLNYYGRAPTKLTVHFGTWEDEAIGDPKLGIWHSFEPEPMAVVDTASWFTGDGFRTDPRQVVIPIPTSELQPGQLLKLALRDSEDLSFIWDGIDGVSTQGGGFRKEGLQLVVTIEESEA